MELERRIGAHMGKFMIMVLLILTIQQFSVSARNDTSKMPAKTLKISKGIINLEHDFNNMGIEENSEDMKNLMMRITSQVPWYDNPSDLTKSIELQIYNGLTPHLCEKKRDIYDMNSTYMNEKQQCKDYEFFMLRLSHSRKPYVVYSKTSDKNYKETQTEESRCKVEFDIIMEIINNGFASIRPSIIAITDCSPLLTAKKTQSEKGISNIRDKHARNGSDAVVYVITNNLTDDEIELLKQTTSSGETYMSEFIKQGATVILGSSGELHNGGNNIIKYMNYLKDSVSDVYAVLPESACKNIKHKYTFMFPKHIEDTYGYKKCLDAKYKLRDYKINSENDMSNNSDVGSNIYSHKYIIKGLDATKTGALYKSGYDMMGNEKINPTGRKVMFTGIVACSTALVLGGMVYKFYNVYRAAGTNTLDVTNIDNDIMNDYDLPEDKDDMGICELNTIRNEHYNPL